MKLNQLICTIFILSSFANILSDNNNVKLSSPIIDFDGSLINLNKIRKIIWMGKKLSEVQFGEVDPVTKKRKAQYEFKGQLYTLKELVKMEEEYKTKNKQLKNENSTVYKKMFEPYVNALNNIKHKFEGLVDPFIKDSYGAERLMRDLIKDSCNQRDRSDSLLIKWAETFLDIREKKIAWKEGIEHEVFRKHVTSLKKLDLFCSDLTNFLKDLVRSCPKALKLYQDWEKQHKQDQNK